MSISKSITSNPELKKAQTAVNTAEKNYSNAQFKTSDITNNYKNQLDSLGNYKSSYAEKIQSTLGNIENGYNPNADKLYQQYKEQYTREGLNASRDVSAQVASLNGGADSSMGRRQASQAYYNYLQGLNDKIPELAQTWQNNQYSYLSALQGLDDSDYNKYSNDRNYLSSMYQWSNDNDMTLYNAALEKLYNTYVMKNNDLGNKMSYSQWANEFNENKRQFGLQYALDKASNAASIAATKADIANTKASTATAKTNTTSSSGEASKTSNSYNTSAENVVVDFQTAKRKLEGMFENLGINGSASMTGMAQAVYGANRYVDDLYAKGYINEKVYDKLKRYIQKQ